MDGGLVGRMYGPNNVVTGSASSFTPVDIQIIKEPPNVSYFDLPYVDNIKLAEGNRFALVLKGIYRGSDEDESAEADIEAIRFRNDFMSLRDRPLFEEMLKKLQQSPSTR
ncbi:MAG: hypothetical protein NNA23_06280 [Nitrospira sp.]|nr:hypothetical protein [Nitrospira sp.]